MIAVLLALVAPQATVPPAMPVVAPAESARLDAATRLIGIMRLDATLDILFVQLAPSFAQSVIGTLATNVNSREVINRLVAAAPGNRDRMVAILSQEFLTSVKSRYPALKAQMAQEYAASFTLEELDAITAFYSSGPGAKALRLMPELQQRMAVAGQVLGRAAGQEAGARAFTRIQREMLPERTKPAA